LVCVNNAINYEKVINGAEAGEEYVYNSHRYLMINESQQNGVVQFKGILLPQKEHVSFVTVGRLSPEKDHAKLIKAFSKIVLFNSNARLYIIGDGPLKNNLINLIKKLGLNDKVFLTGKLSNPFRIVNECDCFILSSHYEGQPLVLLEAMILRKPIIGTDVTGIRSVLKEQYGELVENSEDGLVNGMLKFLRGEVNAGKFDYVDYNRKAMKMFYKEVCHID
jgi:CDP-glycerol glycerophosphotransferase